MKSVRLPVASPVAALALSACAATEPTFGERLRTQGVEMARVGDTWTKGADAVAEGSELIARGEDRVRDGQRDIARGETLSRDGNAMMAEAEAQHRRETAVDGMNGADARSQARQPS